MRYVASPPTAQIDADTYLVLDDFGKLGSVYRATQVDQANEQTVVRDIISRQYNSPERVIAFNTVERWARDVSEDIGRAVAGSVGDAGDLSKSAQEFVERQLGEDWQSSLAIKNSRHAVRD